MPRVEATNPVERAAASTARREPSAAGKLLSLMTPRERRQMALLAVAVFGMAVLEVAGIASIMPFMAVLANPGAVEGSPYFQKLYALLALQNPNQLLMAMGIGVLVILLINNAYSAYINWLLLRFTHERMHTLSERLLGSYLARPYVFFLDRNSAELVKNVLPEVSRVVGSILVPVVHATSRAAVALLIVALLLAVDPVLALSVFVVLGGAYALLFMLVRKRLAEIGRASIETATQRYRHATEALHGIKDIKLLGIEREFLERYSVPSRRAARYEALAQAVSMLPRYALETIAFGGILIIVLYLMAAKGTVAQALPLIALYAFAGYRLLPALQQVFATVTQLRFNLPALDNLWHDLRGSAPTGADTEPAQPLVMRDRVVLSGVTFNYPGVQTPVLRALDLEIPACSTIGLVGTTGAGKTTLVDLLLGLLMPTAGALQVDGRALGDRDLRAWRAGLGYVPQAIYLSDDTIAANIAFGIPAGRIDMAAVEKAGRAANLHAFVSELPEGYLTRVGERGVRLSGGQRQRIAIARALYRDPHLLVLDEATSALDSITENAVMEAIHNFSHRKTLVVVAHRVTTLKECDVIYVLSGGRLVARGSYDELLSTNRDFRSMAKVD